LTCSQGIPSCWKARPRYVSPDDAYSFAPTNRTYYTTRHSPPLRPIQTGTLTHNLTAPLRYHEDEVDRFQDQDGYRID